MSVLRVFGKLQSTWAALWAKIPYGEAQSQAAIKVCFPAVERGVLA